MGVFTAAREEKADRYNAARKRTVERFLSQTYYQRKAEQDLLTRVSTETAEDYVLRQENYLAVIKRLCEETGAFRDNYRERYEREGEPLYLLTAECLEHEYKYLDISRRIVEENIVRAESAAFYANRLAWIWRKVRKGWLAALSRDQQLPDEVKAYIAQV